MTNIRSVIFGVVLGALLLGGVALAQQDTLIVPGERVAMYKLGTSLAEVIQLLGAVGERSSTTMPNSYGLWWKDRGLFFSFFNSSHTVSGITVLDTLENRMFRTVEGIGIGSSVTGLDRFGNPEWRQTFSNGVEARAYWKIGLYTQSRDSGLIAIGVFDNKTR